MEEKILAELTRPLQLLKPVTSAVAGMRTNPLAQSWLWRRAAITHVQQCVAMTGAPGGFYGADFPVEVQLNKLWHDEDSDEIRELEGVAFEDREPLADTNRVWKAVEYTSGWWQKNKDQAKPGVYEKIMDVLGRKERGITALKKTERIGLLMRANGFDEEDMDAVELLNVDKTDKAKIGLYFNFSPIALIMMKLEQWDCKVLSSAYHVTFDADLIRHEGTEEELRVKAHLFRFKFKIRDKHITYPFYFTQAGATHP